MTYELTPAQRATMDPDVLALIDQQTRLHQWRDREAITTHTTTPTPPEGLKGAALIAWARQNQPPAVELQPAGPVQHRVVTEVPAHVAAMSPTDRMRWVRGTLNK